MKKCGNKYCFVFFVRSFLFCFYQKVYFIMGMRFFASIVTSYVFYYHMFVCVPIKIYKVRTETLWALQTLFHYIFGIKFYKWNDSGTLYTCNLRRDKIKDGIGNMKIVLDMMTKSKLLWKCHCHILTIGAAPLIYI